jgi:two-component system nitrogen regulation sensor histidine kinase NtrY
MDKNNYIVIMIKDNGVGFGIFQDNIKDILNPYFTTKKTGTGLGLAIVNKIINDHQGLLEFKPLDDGAQIQIRFDK